MRRAGAEATQAQEREEPAWNSEMTLISEDSAPLSFGPTFTLAHRRSCDSLVTECGQLYKRSRSEPYSAPSPTWILPTKALLPGHEDIAYTQDPSVSRDPTSYMPLPSHIGGLAESLPTPFIPWGADFSPDVPEADDMWAPGPAPRSSCPPRSSPCSARAAR